MQIWFLPVNRNFQPKGDVITVDVGTSAMSLHKVKDVIKGSSTFLTQFDNTRLMIWTPNVNSNCKDINVLMDALNNKQNFNKHHGNTLVNNLKVSDNEVIVLQILTDISRTSTAPGAFSDSLVDKHGGHPATPIHDQPAEEHVLDLKEFDHIFTPYT